MLYLTFISAPEQQTPNTSASISSSSSEWTVLRQTGEESNFKVIFYNNSLKKTEICFVLKDGVNPSSVDLTAKQLYNQDGSLTLDDKNKPITLKYETAKCNDMGVMKNGYHISLTDAQSVNINNFIKIGNTTLIVAYQNESKINYQYDYGETNFTLLKEGYFSNDIFVYWDEIKYKIGANDSYMNDSETANFTYLINSTQKLFVRNKTEWAYTDLDIPVYYSFSYPIFYNINFVGNNESREVYNFKDICSNTYSNCTWQYDDNNAIINFVSGNVIDPEIENIIKITDSEHLNSSRGFIENIFFYVEERDDIWKEIPQNNFVRVVFEKNLTNQNDITIYAKSNQTGEIAVYKKDDENEIARFVNVNESKYYKIYLTNLTGIEYIFDLKVLNNNISFDYIVDPVTCDQGDTSTTCNLTTAHYVDNGSVNNFNNLIIKSGGSIQNATANCTGTSYGCGFSLNLTGNLTILSGGLIKGGNISITADNVDVQSGGKIQTDGLGWMTLNGPGKGVYSAGTGTYSGGGNGGTGGHGTDCWAAGGTYGVNDSFINPNTMGSGGGGTAGGGVIFINVTNNLTINGAISSNGTDGTGSGAGGSIWIITNTSAGSGVIMAPGGKGTSEGSGGGGRISINFTSSTYTGKYWVMGVRATAVFGNPEKGHPGTLYLPPNQNLTVITDTALGHGNYTFDYVNVSNGAMLECQGNTTDPNTDSGGSAGTPHGSGCVINAININIDSGTKISADHMGFNGQGGPGPGTWHSGTLTGCGGANGGNGGSAQYCTGGTKYGNFLRPSALGSGGGGSSIKGAGAIKLNATNITINGNITANARNAADLGCGNNDDGGGAGGSIWLIASDSIIGTGKINASGGRTIATSGSGGGGRIALYADTINLSSMSLSLDGGLFVTANTRGSGGTIFVNATNSVTSSGNISAVGHNGGFINITDTLLTLSGIYNATGSSSNGKITINYTSCSSSFTGTFNPTPVWLNTTDCGDTIYPLFSGYWDNNASLIDSGTGYFNVTVENTNGTVILHLGSNNVYATNLTSNVYNASITFTESGTYSYNWTAYGNGSSKNLNTSEIRSYTVNASNSYSQAPNLSLTFTAPLTKLSNLSKKSTLDFLFLSTINRISSLTSKVTQEININNLISKFFGISKSITQTLNIDALSSRVLGAFKSIQQLFSIDNLVARLTSIFKSNTQTVLLSPSVSESGGMVRTSTQSIIIGNLVSNIRNFFKSTSQTLNIDALSSRVYNSFKSIQQNIDISIITSRISSFFRSFLDLIRMNLDTSYTASGVTSFSANLSQSISTNIIIDRIGGINRFLSQTFNLDALVSRLSKVSSKITQSLSFEALSSKISGLSKLTSQTLSINAFTDRIRKINLQINQSFNFDAVVSRLGNFFRNILQGINYIAELIFPSSGTPGGGYRASTYIGLLPVICPILDNYIINNTYDGILYYNKDHMIKINTEINTITNKNLSITDLVNYLKDYNNLCPKNEEVPYFALSSESSFFAITSPSLKSDLWPKYKYWFIFLSVITVGILIFETSKRSKKKKIGIRSVEINGK